MIYAAFALLSLIGSCASHNPLTGAIVAVQSRCQGYLCPDWAMDVSRYDTIEYRDEQFEYVLNENLPLGPTAERSFETYSAYDPSTRLYTSVAADYPDQGVDSFWVHTINDYVNATKAVATNVLLAHPDASADHPGSMHLTRVLAAPALNATVAVFGDGSVHVINLETQQYTKVASVLDTVSFAVPKMTYAHVIDGTILKSFIMDSDENAYLVKVDLSSSPATVSEPLKIIYIKGMEFHNTPFNALMTAPAVGMPLQLTVFITGNFDQIQWVDEESGELIELVNSLTEMESPSEFMCFESTKDCDFWRTAAYDPDEAMLYFQSHTVDAQGTASETMMRMGWTISKVNGQYYPYINTAMWPMNFGYSGYQYVSIKQE